MTKAIRVRLKDRAYDVCFGPVSDISLALKALGFSSGSAFVVTSKSVQDAGHASDVVRALKKNRLAVTLAVLPDGESHKTLETVSRLYAQALEAGLDRKSLVVAVGGGVTTDLAGFFAATYMRGLSYVSVPTTLLGMVDAAIGGKTGVDLPQGKNLAGAFWQPRLVWIDPTVLKTLPVREWRTGFAEIIKYGVIKSAPFFDWLEQRLRANPQVKTWPPEDVERAIRVSVGIKADVVSADEKETPLKGGREILNFGHTVGHALEAALGYTALSHGEAISIGMAVAGRLALEHGLWSNNDQVRMLSLLRVTGLPTRFPALSTRERDKFWSALRSDKKNVAGRLRFVLPEKMGKVQVRSGIAISDVKKSCPPPPRPR